METGISKAQGNVLTHVLIHILLISEWMVLEAPAPHRHMMHDTSSGELSHQNWATHRLIILAFRPETVESLFIAFRLTGNARYRQIGWDIFQSIEKYCRIEKGGFASIMNVDDVNSKLEDRMETFLMVSPRALLGIDSF